MAMEAPSWIKAVLNWRWNIILNLILKLGEIGAVVLLFIHYWHGATEDFKFGFLTLCILLILIISVNLYLTLRTIGQNERWVNEKTNLILSHSAELKKFERKSKYADILPALNNAFSVLHEVYRDNTSDKRAFINAFDKFCTKLAVVFTKVTGNDCSVCIKINNNPTAETINTVNPVFSYKAFDLSRDNLIENRESNEAIEHWYKDNTDFDMIFKNIKAEKGKYFLCNSLPKLLFYSNTSFLKYGYPLTGFPPNTSLDEKLSNWPLKYRSTVVAPICPSISDHRNKEKLLGFLCVDSNSMDIFLETIDTELLIGCADGMWNVLYKFLEKFPTTTT